MATKKDGKEAAARKLRHAADKINRAADAIEDASEDLSNRGQAKHVRHTASGARDPTEEANKTADVLEDLAATAADDD